MDDDEVEVGDTVTIGNGGTVHWSVLKIDLSAHEVPWAYLKSGMMGRHRHVRVAMLHLHSKGTGHA